ncbi:hypothetical protein MTO96_032354 [Rhipicephalus appendiculatus]
MNKSRHRLPSIRSRGTSRAASSTTRCPTHYVNRSSLFSPSVVVQNPGLVFAPRGVPPDKRPVAKVDQGTASPRHLRGGASTQEQLERGRVCDVTTPSAADRAVSLSEHRRQGEEQQQLRSRR